ncbi:uncharacterized protein F4822DRAFT_255337 [Hypoxylon trugodes]|uniref:uncharacterized protein n=1 Tax=Hypoxylon trugodes TaxID=326681 RepID=UPI002192E302|nr:uncharacterized protein F4822DRAFT_255337 [Hypoxylon trugodes]KAI1388740.1 hypothetical protein F4822DRAFT_255337 [Hypoxylon trugodes]
MQKILRRVATAERVAAKRQKAKDLRIFKKEKKESLNDHKSQMQMVRSELVAAKNSIRDNWNLGPLAPRKDVGEWAESEGAVVHEARYGTGYRRVSLAMRNRRCAWAGGAYNLNLAVGDRVVLMEGPDEGRIGQIGRINEEKAEVQVNGLNKANIRLQQEIRGQTDAPALNTELPIPISAIRLVHPIKDTQTGVTRDVIINQLVHADFIHDRVTGKKQWSRVVPGLNVSIPWPKEAEEELKDYASDTLRIDVEERTFTPTLLHPPMPESVLDELRNKYSRFRTRHDPEYIERLEAEEQAKKDRQKLMNSMRTPLQELHRAERENKKKKGKPRLTQEMLEKIGEVMAKNLERTRNAGVALPEAPSSSSAPTTSSEIAVPPPPPETTTEETPPPPSS